jgi:hypothetical protein
MAPFTPRATTKANLVTDPITDEFMSQILATYDVSEAEQKEIRALL